MSNEIRLITGEDWRALENAHRVLEHPSLAARLTSLVGLPIEQGIRLLPHDWNEMLRRTLHGAVEKSLAAALVSLPTHRTPAGHRIHTALGAATGALAGAFGLPALLLELPVTTTIMLRDIAAVAARHGEDLGDAVTRAECVKVFALGGRAADDDAAEAGYYGLRLTLATHFRPILGAADALPGSISLLRSVAQRFGIAITDKAAAQMTPVIGALGASALNIVFIRHYHAMANGHFTVRRLERTYGASAVQAAYRDIGSRGA